MPTKKKEENGNGLFPSTFSVLVQSDNLLLHTFHFLQFFSLSDPISFSIFGCSCTITCFLFELWLLETKIISKNDHNCFGKDNTFSKRLESKVTIWWWRWTLTPSIPFRLRRLTRSMAANKKKKRRTGSQPRREPCFFLRVIQWTCLEQLMRDVVVLLRVVCYSNPENRRIAGVYWVIWFPILRDPYNPPAPPT